MLPPDGTIKRNSIGSPNAALVDQSPPQSSITQLLFDPSDPALFNFDIASLKFGSHHGALEFGVLGQMSDGGAGGNAGGVGTPDNSDNNSGSVSTYGYSPGVGGDDFVGITAASLDSTGLGGQWATSRSARQAGGAAATA